MGISVQAKDKIEKYTEVLDKHVPICDVDIDILDLGFELTKVEWANLPSELRRYYEDSPEIFTEQVTVEHRWPFKDKVHDTEYVQVPMYEGYITLQSWCPKLGVSYQVAKKSSGYGLYRTGSLLVDVYAPETFTFTSDIPNYGVHDSSRTIYHRMYRHMSCSNKQQLYYDYYGTSAPELLLKLNKIQWVDKVLTVLPEELEEISSNGYILLE